MRTIIVQTLAILACSTMAHAQARIVITEIMYNPASTEKRGETEWIEIANAGNESIDIKDWTIKVVNKKVTFGTFACTLAPGGVAVLVNADAVNEEQFRAAWDSADDSASSESAKFAYQVIAIKWGGLSNNPTAENALQLANGSGKVICELKFDDSLPRVKGSGGPSVFLTDCKADATTGTVWRISELDKDGARSATITAIFDKQDIGSPGHVPGLSPTPAPTAPKTVTADAEKPKADETIDY